MFLRSGCGVHAEARRGKVRRRAVAVAVGVALCAALPPLALGAGSQSTTAAQTSGAPNRGAPAKPKPATLQTVIVTGSLVASPNETAASPILTASPTQLQEGRSSVTIGDLLNTLPQFQPDTGSFNVVGTTGASAGPGVTSINLRGLGANRNLVLMDGDRLPPADVNGDVDVNMIPDVAVGHIDIITGGASAIYGSDAMSGVVNFRTIPYFDGIKGNIQYGNSTRGDLSQSRASVALGGEFPNSRGHFIVAVGYGKSQGLLGSKRSFESHTVDSSYIGQGTFVPTPGNLVPEDVLNKLFAGYGVTGPVANTLALGFNNDGSLFTQQGALNYKGPTSDGFQVVNGNVVMPVGYQQFIAIPVERKQFFTKFDYDLSDHAQAYGRVMYVRSATSDGSGMGLTQFVVPEIPVTNPFIPPDLATLLAARPNPTAPFQYHRRFTEAGRRVADNDVDNGQYLLGVRGGIAGDWTYNLYASHGFYDLSQTTPNAVIASQVQNLLSAPGGGSSICAGGYNPFGLANANAISPACLSYITFPTTDTQHITQNVLQATVQGSLFSVPAGDVRLAVQAGRRSETYSFVPDPFEADGQVEAVLASAPTSGSLGIRHLAMQLEVPIISGLPGVNFLVSDSAVRRSWSDVTGGVTTFEQDLKWNFTPSLMFRAGFQRAVRSPNIGELFQGPTGVQVGIGTPPSSVGDPCDIRSPARSGAQAADVEALCVAQGVPAALLDTYEFATTAVAGITQGNTDLSPEKANTINFGLTYDSTAKDGLLRSMSASVDYYDIKISHVISQVPGLTSLDGCFNLDGSNPTYSIENPQCTLISRDSSGQLREISEPFMNLGSLETSGADVQFSWSPRARDLGLPIPGVFSASSFWSWVRTWKQQVFRGGTVQNFADTIQYGAAYPRWRGVTTIGYGIGRLNVGLRWNYLSSMKDATSVTAPSHPSPGVPSYSTFDFFGSYAVSKSLTINGGVSNFTDRLPLTVSSSQFGTYTPLYSGVGATYYVGVSFRM